MKKYLTPEGLEKLKKELEYLKTVKRREIAERLKHTASFGDLTENAAYLETKEAQGFLEGRILELENLIKSAKVIKKNKRNDIIQIGSTVILSSGIKKEKFQIVGVAETDPSEGKISADSPLGKALLDRKKGEVFEIETPQGKIKYKILKIE
mgnify:CR=1 FL=1